MDLLKLRAEILIGYIILFLIQEVPMLHTFNGPCHTTNEKYMKNVIAIMFFHVFLIFHVGRSIRSMKHAYPLDEELKIASKKYSY